MEEKRMFIVHLKDGRAIKEDEKINGVVHDWKHIKAISNNLKDVTSVQIVNNGRYYTLSVNGFSNLDILQLKANVLDMMAGTDMLVERVLGVVLKDDNGKPLFAIKMRIGEKTGGVVLAVERKTEKGWQKL
jgi:hypothetical protein